MTGQVLVRLVPDLATRLNAAAVEAGLTAPAFVRQLIVSALSANPADARPSSPRTTIPVDVAEVGRLSRMVSRLNGGVVQLSKALRERGDDNSAVESVLADLRSAQKDVAALARGGRHAVGRDAG